MSKIKCMLGFHNLEDLGTQRVKGLSDGVSGHPAERSVKGCLYCGKIKYESVIAFTTWHLDNKLDWQPEIDYASFRRRIRINQLLKGKDKK